MKSAEIYLFGSITAGDLDAGSDVDVLVVSERPNPAAFPPNWSVYSQDRLRELFRQGTLFAWHLHEGAVKIWPRQPGGLLAELGSPAPYENAANEIAALMKVAHDAIDELVRGTPSVIYELGLLYLTARDVAMAAAPISLGRFLFSRRAPLHYENPRFPLSDLEYDYLMTCRRAGTRGIHAEYNPLVARAIVAKGEALKSWLQVLHEVTADG